MQNYRLELKNCLFFMIHIKKPDFSPAIFSIEKG